MLAEFSVTAILCNDDCIERRASARRAGVPADRAGFVRYDSQCVGLFRELWDWMPRSTGRRVGANPPGAIVAAVLSIADAVDRAAGIDDNEKVIVDRGGTVRMATDLEAEWDRSLP